MPEWVKLGGDKGGGMTFQICNVDHPNSPANTCAFCVFEACDQPQSSTAEVHAHQDMEVLWDK